MKVILGSFLVLLSSTSAFSAPRTTECLAEANATANFVFDNGAETLTNGRVDSRPVTIVDGDVLTSKPTGEALYEYSTSGRLYVHVGDQPKYKYDIWIQLDQDCRIVTIKTNMKFMGY